MNDITSIGQSKPVSQKTLDRSGPDQAAATDRGGKELPAKADQSVPVERSKATQEAEQVRQAASKLNDYVASLQRDLRFSVDESLGRPVVTVIDGATQEVIRQIPSETALNLARNLKDRMSEINLQDSRVDNGNLGLINTRI